MFLKRLFPKKELFLNFTFPLFVSKFNILNDVRIRFQKLREKARLDVAAKIAPYQKIIESMGGR